MKLSMHTESNESMYRAEIHRQNKTAFVLSLFFIIPWFGSALGTLIFMMVSANWFFVPAIMLMVLIGYGICYSVFWRFFGTETILVTGETVSVRRSMSGVKFTMTYNISYVERLRYESKKYTGLDEYIVSFLSLNGVVLFNYDWRKISIGTGISEKQANEIIKSIRHYKNK